MAFTVNISFVCYFIVDKINSTVGSFSLKVIPAPAILQQEARYVISAVETRLPRHDIKFACSH